MLNGPGWKKGDNYIIPQNLHSKFYSYSKIGLNLHIDLSLKYNSEINERTFILAACGVFQICDNPKSLNDFFRKESIVSAKDSSEYIKFCKHFLVNEEERNSYRSNSKIGRAHV